MKYLLPIFLCFFVCMLTAQSHNEEELAAIQTVKNLFDGMRAGDSTVVRAAFTENATLETVFYDKEGISKRNTGGTVDKFATAVGTPHDEIWDEKIWSYDVRIDANLASVWTDYTFYLGDKLSHCGVNAFHLFKTEQSWKISHITDTRRRDNCQTEIKDTKIEIDTFLNQWHRAAATANAEVFFGSMTEDGIYIGTDATELWLRDELKEWSKKYFDRDSAWDFTPTERNIYFSKNGQMAWFDELLDTWMGDCRSSGILTRVDDEWKIKHYHLSVAVPNDVIQDFIQLVNGAEKKD